MSETPAQSKPTLYLAGPVNSLADGGATWRNRVEDEYSDKYNFKNPLDQYNVPVDDLTVVSQGDDRLDQPGFVSHREIVKSDKRMLRESDGVLIGYVQTESIGTPMECMWAYDRRYPIGLWVRDETDYSELETWYLDHCPDIAYSLDETLQGIQRQIETQSIVDQLYSTALTRLLPG